MGKLDKFEAWGWLVIVSGVVVTAVLFVLIGVAIFAIMQDRPVAYVSVIVITVSLLALWAITWGALWLISGRRQLPAAGSSVLIDELEQLRQENERLKKRLAELSE